MVETLGHRGPDDTGFYVDNHLMLGQCRLSIIDLKTGRQPIFNEDGSIVVVYNGEIYNFRELRKQLESSGHSFSTNSDTEVVVHAYEQYGLRAIERFNGMFAFALYDSKRNQLILARDRQGIKPLYMANVEGRIIFASEIKAILRFPGVVRKLNEEALSCFLTLRYVPSHATLFRGIRKVLPGHYVVIDESGVKEERYWTLNPQPVGGRPEPSRLLDILRQSVERHMVSDVPVGVYLSGGLDSASMVAFASTLSDEPLNTFCMGFGEQTDELADAKAIAEHFGTKHHETVVSGELLTEFPKMIWHMDSPKRNLYPYYLADLASRHVKVVLSGLGGDELFGGYDFRYQALASLDPEGGDARVAAYLRTQARDVPQDQSEVYGKAVRNVNNDCARDFLRPFFDSDLPFMEQVLVADFNAKMIYDFLPVDDATSMAHSVETRVPFLDNELVDFAFRIPFSEKFKDGKGKHIFRKAVATILPARALEKKKQGFGPNPYEVYRRELRKYAEEYVASGLAVKKGFVNGDWVRDLLQRGASPEALADYNKLWDCLALEVFLRIYFDEELIATPSWDSI